MDRIPHVPQRVIDTHIHLWDPDRLAYPWLSAGFDELPGRYLPRDFQRDAADVNLIATVHVQAEIDHDLDPVLETEWLDELADAHETPTAIIGYADLRDPALAMCWPGMPGRHASVVFGRRRGSIHNPVAPTSRGQPVG
jgi:predicted TIM-barrel fold metal-dependent hydrolase